MFKFFVTMLGYYHFFFTNEKTRVYQDLCTISVREPKSEQFWLLSPGILISTTSLILWVKNNITPEKQCQNYYMRTQCVAGLMKKYLRHGELPCWLEARGTSVGALWVVDVFPAVDVVGTSVARVMGQSHRRHGTQSLTMVVSVRRGGGQREGWCRTDTSSSARSAKAFHVTRKGSKPKSVV